MTEREEKTFAEAVEELGQAWNELMRELEKHFTPRMIWVWSLIWLLIYAVVCIITRHR